VDIKIYKKRIHRLERVLFVEFKTGFEIAAKIEPSRDYSTFPYFDIIITRSRGAVVVCQTLCRGFAGSIEI
jgi:hypothetical protein